MVSFHATFLLITRIHSIQNEKILLYLKVQENSINRKLCFALRKEISMREYFSNSVSETEKIAAEFAAELKEGDVIAYIGGLGVGKTAFTRGLAKGLNVKGEISSPTFALVHEYRGNPSLYHFDMYRIHSMDDLYSAGYFDYLDLNQIIAIEWSENITDYLEDNTIFIEIIPVGEEKRSIKIYGGNRF